MKKMSLAIVTTIAALACILAGCTSTPATLEQVKEVNIHDYYSWNDSLGSTELRLEEYLEACGVKNTHFVNGENSIIGKVNGKDLRIAYEVIDGGDDQRLLTQVKFAYGDNDDVYTFGYIDDELTPSTTDGDDLVIVRSSPTGMRPIYWTLRLSVVEDLTKVLNSGNLIEATAEDPLADLGITYKVIDHFGNATTHRA